MSQTKNLTIAAAVVSLGGFLFGFDASVISGVVGYVTPAFGLSDTQLGWVVGAPTLAGTLAGLTAGPTSDIVGRKTVLLALAALYSVSAVASALAPDVATLVAARFLGGLAFASLGIGPLYIGEIAPPAQRGALISIAQLAVVLGFSTAYFSNYGIAQLASGHTPWVHAMGLAAHPWRWMLGIEALPAVLWGILLLGLPRSPRWLLLHNRTDEAREVLAFMQPEPTRSDFVRGSIDRKPSELRSPADKGIDSTIAAIQATVGVRMNLATQLRLLADPACGGP